MIRINLLPPLQRRPKYPANWIIGFISALIFVSCTALYCYNVFVIWNLERQITESQNQYELLRPTQQAMDSAGSAQQVINAKTNILTGLTTERKPWAPIITHLAAITTPRVWFTEVGETDKDTLKVVGIADNYQELATFLQHLEQDGMFVDPSLIQADNSPNQALVGTRYEITFKLKGMK